MKVITETRLYLRYEGYNLHQKHVVPDEGYSETRRT